jgi:hypothetical protein
MSFSETIVPSGTVLYKGLPVSCDVLLKDLRAFYLTDRPEQARQYGNVCSYRVKKTLRLFNMTHDNIRILLRGPDLDFRTKRRLQLAFGTNTTLSVQIKKLAKHAGPNNLPKGAKGRGERASWTELNRILDMYFSREFLIKHGYDGYYAANKRSVFHEGHFNSEIMLTNAYQKIERAHDRLPVASRRVLLFPQTISRLFLEYSKRHRGMLKSSPEFTVFCTGGQGVNLLLRGLKRKIPRLIRGTTDFDMSFAVPEPLKSIAALKRKSEAMRKFMLAHITGFVAFINRNYKGARATFRLNRLGQGTLHPRAQVPATKRRTYLVHNWQIVIGKQVVDLADAALALYPGASRKWLSKRFSSETGVPIQQLKYQFIDTLAILSGSFVHKGVVKQRNPLTGKKMEKGQKNVARVNQMSRVIAAHPKAYKNIVPATLKARALLNKIRTGHLPGAEARARSANRIIKNMSSVSKA